MTKHKIHMQLPQLEKYPPGIDRFAFFPSSNKEDIFVICWYNMNFETKTHLKCHIWRNKYLSGVDTFANLFQSVSQPKSLTHPPVWYRNSVVQIKEPIVCKDIWLRGKVNISKDDKGCWRATNHVHLYFQNCTPSSFGKSGFCIWAVCTLRLWEMEKIIVKPRGCDIFLSQQHCF